MEGSPAIRNLTVKVTVPPRSFLSTLIRHLVPLPLGGIRGGLTRRGAGGRSRELECLRLGAIAPREGSRPRAEVVCQWARWARATERGGACCSGHQVYGHGNVVARIPRVKPRCPTSERDYSGRHLSALGPSTTTGCIGSSERGAQESPRRALVAPKESQQRARIVRGTEQLEKRAADTERRTQCTGMSATRAGRSKGDSVTRAGGATSAARAGRARPNSRGPLEPLPLEGASRAMDNLGVPVKRHVVGDL